MTEGPVATGSRWFHRRSLERVQVILIAIDVWGGELVVYRSGADDRVYARPLGLFLEVYKEAQ